MAEPQGPSSEEDRRQAADETGPRAADEQGAADEHEQRASDEQRAAGGVHAPEGQQSRARHFVDLEPGVESASALMRDLKAVTAEAREILNAAPGRVKIDLENPQGWQELHEALLGDRLGTRLPGESVDQLRRLIARWRQYYERLRFVARTRPVWNS